MSFLTKEVEKVYSFSTISDDRFASHQVVINGRQYYKLGQEQAVTLVGVLYNIFDPSVKQYKKVLHVGVAKQHPSDIEVNKELAYEVAHERALMDPQVTMEVGANWRKYNFTQFARNYVDAMKLQLVRTPEEIANLNLTKISA